MAGASCKLDNKVSAEITIKKARIRGAVNELFGNIVLVREGRLKPLRDKLDGKKGKTGLLKKQLDLKLKIQNRTIDISKSVKGKIVYKKKQTILPKSELKEAKDELKNISAEIIAIRRDLSDQLKRQKQGKNKYDLVNNIRNKIISRMDRFAETKGFNLDPWLIPRVLKGHITSRGFVFNSLNDLSVDQLRSIDTSLTKMFDMQDKGKLIGKIGGFWSMIVDEFYDPAVATMLYDGTMNALEIIKKTKEFADNREKDIQKMLRPVKIMNEKIQNLIEAVLLKNDNYWGISPEERKKYPKDFKSWTVRQKNKMKEMTINAVHSFINELADGEVKFMQMGKASDYIFAKDDTPIQKNQKKKLLAKINKITNKAMNHQFEEFGEDSLGPDIEYISPDGINRMYYVMIKNILPDGKEVTKAYFIPTKTHDGRYEIIYPFKRSGKNQAKYTQTYLKAYTDKTLGANAFEATKNFEGYYKANHEVKHRGYKYKTVIDKHGNKVIKKAKYDKDIKKEDIVISAWNGFNKMKDSEIPPAGLLDSNAFITKKDSTKGKVEYQKGDHLTIWGALREIRNITTILEKDMLQMSEYNNNKYNSGLKKLKEAFNKETYDELLDELSNTLGMDISIKKYEGTLVSANDNIGVIKKDYYPRRFIDGVKEANLWKALTGMREKIEIIKGNIKFDKDEAVKHRKDHEGRSSSKIAERLKLRMNSLSEYLEDFQIIEAKINMMTNKTSMREYNNIRLNKIVRAGKHRTDFTDAAQRRKDPEVLIDHIRELYGDLYHNQLMADVLPNLAGLANRKDLVAYTVDHVRASVGFVDTRASLFGFDMSFPGWAERMNKIPFIKKKYTPEMVYKGFQKYGMLTSGTLLRTGSSIMNNTQRFNFIISDGWEVSFEAWKRVRNNEPLAEQIAKEAGVLDLVTSLADMLAGGFGDETTGWTDSFIPLGQIALLQGSKFDFIKSKGWFRDLFTKVVTENTRGIKGEALAKEVDMLLNDTWMTIHGITDNVQAAKKTAKRKLKEAIKNKDKKEVIKQQKRLGELAKEKEVISEKDLKNLMSRFRDYGLTQHYIDKFVSYGLSYLPDFMEPLKNYFTFTGVEKRMRMEAAMVGYITAQKAGLMKKHSLDQEKERKQWEDDYPHDWLEPAVLEVIRNTVYASMFGMSTNFHPKIFRGANKLVFQFKQFPFFQSKNDWEIWQNWWRSISTLPVDKRMKEIARLTIPLKGEDKSETRAILRRFLLMRGLISTLSVGLFYLPLISEISSFGARFLQKRFGRAGLGFGFGNALSRGLESPLVAMPQRLLVMMIYLFLGTTGHEDDDDEYDDASKDTFRFFVPYFINIFREMSQKEDNVSKAEHIMHYIPGVSDASDAIIGAYKASQRVD